MKLLNPLDWVKDGINVCQFVDENGVVDDWTFIKGDKFGYVNRSNPSAVFETSSLKAIPCAVT